LDNPQKLIKLRVEALIFTGGMNKNYIGYSLQVEEVGGFSHEMNKNSSEACATFPRALWLKKHPHILP
jgi:hypothetical protein